MKRIVSAALLLMGSWSFAVHAGADEGAYKNLVGMARAAQTERGPDADDAPERASTGTEALKDALADVPAPRAPSSPKAVPAAPAASLVAAEPRLAAPLVVAPPALEKPRLWTRLYSTLLPSWRRPLSLQGAFDPMVSTVPFRAAPAPLPSLMPPPDSEAVSAGERRGLAELMSVSPPSAVK